MPRTTRSTRSGATPADSQGSLRFSLANWLLLAAGLLVIVVGFVVLAQGSTVAAPLLLMLGFLLLIPLGIIK
jgi:uncharacterized membrane protein HdeD (DUF308 family)